MTQEEIQRVLEDMPNNLQALLLSVYGHQLTIMARDAYEFQGPGVTKPRLLRDVNEINHRLFPQIRSLYSDDKTVLPPDVLASWIAGEERPSVKNASIQAFERALSLCST